MNNFYLKLKKPIYALAPMASVADSAFRQICKGYGVDILYSEMASATALNYMPDKTLELVRFDEIERPYVVQLFGGKPDDFIKATQIITEVVKPDGIDINFGCPVKKVAKQGAGAILMQDLKTSKQIIKNVIDNTDLPVSIKTRAKSGEMGILKFLDHMSDLDIKALMIHGRSLAQGFSGDIDTAVIKKARDYFGGIILANGGIYNHDDAVRVLNETEADGIGIAQGALGKPWVFKAVRTGQSVERDFSAIRKVALDHAELVYKLKGQNGIYEMRKHLCWYIHGMPGAREMRLKLTQVESLEEIRDILKISKH